MAGIERLGPGSVQSNDFLNSIRWIAQCEIPPAIFHARNADKRSATKPRAFLVRSPPGDGAFHVFWLARFCALARLLGSVFRGLQEPVHAKSYVIFDDESKVQEAQKYRFELVEPRVDAEPVQGGSIFRSDVYHRASWVGGTSLHG